MLSEPTSVGARAVRHARAVGDRQVWRPSRALVLGNGAIGMLSAVQLRLEGLEVWVTGHRPAGSESAALVEGLGARYVLVEEGTVEALAADVGGFDLVLEATGDAQVMASSVGLLGRSGVAVLLGIDGRARDVSVDGRVLGTDYILGNRALIGSVNARSRRLARRRRRAGRRVGPLRRRGGAVRRPARAGRPLRRCAGVPRHQGGAGVRRLTALVCDGRRGCGWDQRR